MADATGGLFPWLPLVAVVALASVPLLVDSSFALHLVIIAMLYAIVASNWDLSLGFGGMFNFAHVAFFGVGAYATALLGKTLGVPVPVAILFGGLAATVAAAAITLPVLRLRGIYVILVTFGFSQLISQVVVSQSDITGGTLGMTFLPAIKIGGYGFDRDGKLGYFYLTLFTLVASTAFLKWFIGTRTGLNQVALRDNEDLARARGVSLSRTRFLGLCASAVFTGIAGGIFVTYLRVASPSIFGFDTLALVLSMLLVGGTGTIFGPIIAAFTLTILAEALVGLGAWRHVLIAAMIIAVLLVSPSGLAGLLSRLRNSTTRSTR